MLRTVYLAFFACSILLAGLSLSRPDLVLRAVASSPAMMERAAQVFDKAYVAFYALTGRSAPNEGPRFLQTSEHRGDESKMGRGLEALRARQMGTDRRTLNEATRFSTPAEVRREVDAALRSLGQGPAGAGPVPSQGAKRLRVEP